MERERERAPYDDDICTLIQVKIRRNSLYCYLHKLIYAPESTDIKYIYYSSKIIWYNTKLTAS